MSPRQLTPRLLLLVVLFGTAGYLLWHWFWSNQPQQRYRAGVAALERLEFERAEALADRLERSGANDWANLLRGRVFLKQTRYSKALSQFNQIKDRGAIRREGAFYSGEAWLNLQQPRAAEEAFRFVLSEAPDQIDAHRHLGALYYDQGDTFRAVDHLEAVARLDPRDARPHALIGLIYAQTDQFPLAAESFRKALAGELPESLRGETAVNLGEALLKLFRHDEAATAVEGVESSRASLVRAAVFTRQNRFSEAHAELEPWLNREPHDPRLLRQSGMIYLAEDRPREAIPLLEQATNLEPSDYPGQYQFGEALARAGYEERATAQRKRAEVIREKIRLIVELSETAAKSPWNPEPRLKLADLWKELGKPELSQMWRQAAAACSGTGPKG